MTFKSPHAEGSELWCEALSHAIEDAVDRDSVAEFREPDPGRWHLGASEIGFPCSRKIWYSFRWARKVEHPGWLHRLFKRGHKEEDNFVHRLRRVGIQVWDRNPDTGDQWRMEHASEHHYGGSLDAIVHVPGLPDYLSTMIGEFKTHNDASFEKLLKDGIRKSKPQHFAQMCSYGGYMGYSLGLYCALNKNNDKFVFRIVPLQRDLGDITFRKAQEIIRSQTPPRRVSESPAYYLCKSCDYQGPCHHRQPITKNCRSCQFASPHEHDKEWTCARYGGPIPRDLVLTGCNDWRPIA